MAPVDVIREFHGRTVCALLAMPRLVVCVADSVASGHAGQDIVAGTVCRLRGCIHSGYMALYDAD